MRLESRLLSMEKKLREQNDNLAAGSAADVAPATTASTTNENGQREHVNDLHQRPVNGHAIPPNRDHEGSVHTHRNEATISSPTASQQTPVMPLEVLDPMLYDCTGDFVPEESPNPESKLEDIRSLPQSLIEALVSQFYRNTYSIFPIIREPEFRQQLDQWTSSGEDDNGFVPVLYALLAVSAIVLPADHAVFNIPEVQGYKSLDLGDLISSHANSKLSLKTHKSGKLARANSVVAHGLLSLYLAEVGQVTEAWVTAGHAIRLYQGLDLYDSASSSMGPVEVQNGHSAVWWCLYILDRSLSTVLLKPLAIDDAECDVNSSDDGESHISVSEDEIDPWFSIITDFYITMGKIYKSVRSIRRLQHSDKCSTNEILHSRLKKHDLELEQYYEKQVLPNMRHTSNDSQRMGLQTIAVCSYFIGVVLLYRQFIETFHIEDPQVYLRCAEAASNCIKLTPKVLDTIPASHFIIQQSRSIYVSAKVLLHCTRLARNENFTKKAWDDVQMGLDLLRKIKIQWPEIKKYQRLTEEDMRRTRIELDRHESFSKTFDLFGSMSGDGNYTRLPGSSPAMSNEMADSNTDRCHKRSRPGVELDDARDTQSPPKRQKSLWPCSYLSPDFPSLFQTGGSEMADDDFTMSFMLDLAALTPTTAFASANLCGREGN